MKKYLLAIGLVLFFTQGVGAYDPVADANDNSKTTYSNELADLQANKTTLVEVQESNADASYKQTWKDNRAGKVQEVEKYFVPTVTMPSCESPIDYVCPSLVSEKIAQGFRTRLNYIDLKNGKLSCSVLNPITQYQTLTTQSETVLHTETFTNQACQEKYSTTKNIDNSESTLKLIEENESFNDQLKQQELKYTVDYKKNGDDKFLDLADILDGLVSFNVELFNLEQTLLTRDLKTRSGYTVLPNDTIVEGLTQSFKSFFDIWNGDGFSSDRFYEDVQTQARIRDVSAALADDSYFMLLDFWLKSNDLIIDIVSILGFIVIGYSVFSTWAMPSITSRVMKLSHHRENDLQRFVAGLFIAIMFFAWDVEKLNIQYESKSDDMVKSELIVQQSNIQALIQLFYSQTNWVADGFAEIAIRSFLSGTTASAGVFDAGQIKAMATEKKILIKELEKRSTIDIEMCSSNYDTKGLIDKLKHYRTQNLDKTADNYDFYDWKSKGGLFLDQSASISTLRANFYPKTEREANAMMESGISIYNSQSQSGIVDKDSVYKFRESNFSPLSLSGCYQNKKQMIAAQSRLDELNELLNNKKSQSTQQSKVEYLKVISEIQWASFAKMGYLSIAFLPATSMMIDNIGILTDDLDKKSKAIDDAVAKNDEDALTDLTTGFIKSISEDLPYLAMFGGYQLAKIIHPIKDKMIDEGLRKVGNASTLITFGMGKVAVKTIRTLRKVRNALKFDKDIDVLDLQIASIIIKSIFQSMIYIVLVVGSLFLFLLLFIEKLFVFFASLFGIMFAFSKNQEQRITSFVSKAFVVGFKTILIVICVFLGIYAVSLASTFELIFINSFFNSMDTIENASWAFKMSEFDLSNIGTLMEMFLYKYLFYGVSKFAFAVLKLVLAVSIMWKMPQFFVELVYERMNSVADSVGESLQQATQTHTARV